MLWTVNVTLAVRTKPPGTPAITVIGYTPGATVGPATITRVVVSPVIIGGKNPFNALRGIPKTSNTTGSAKPPIRVNCIEKVVKPPIGIVLDDGDAVIVKLWIVNVTFAVRVRPPPVPVNVRL